jgi:hypothetical protein
MTTFISKYVFASSPEYLLSLPNSVSCARRGNRTSADQINQRRSSTCGETHCTTSSSFILIFFTQLVLIFLVLIFKMPESKIPQPGPAKLKRNAGPDEWLEAAKDCKYLSEPHMKQLCEIVKEYMMEGEWFLPGFGLEM